MISKLYAKYKLPSAKNTDFDSFHHSPPLKDRVTVGLKRGKLYFIAIITVLRSKKDFYLVNVTLSQNHILLIKMWGRFCTF